MKKMICISMPKTTLLYTHTQFLYSQHPVPVLLPFFLMPLSTS